MELKKGFKQTEIGFIPNSWDVTTVGEQFFIQLGKMLDSEKNIGTPKPYLGNSSVQWGRIDFDPTKLIKLTNDDLQKYRLKLGDLLVCEGGEVGRAAIWNRHDECYYQKALHRLRAKKDYNTRFMLNVLSRFSDKGLLKNFVTQTSIAHLPKDKFELIPIPLPASTDEQEAIANALSDADAYIESLEKLIAKKRLIKKGVMQELLTGKFRLPSFSKKWAKSKIGDLLKIEHGRSQKDVESPNGTIPILATGGQIGWANKFLYDKPSVLIGRKGTINKPQYMETPFWTVDTLFYSTVFSPNSAKFLYYRFCLIDWMSLNEASGVPSLNARTIEAIEIEVPEAVEQNQIAQVLTDIDSDIDLLEDRLNKARLLKQGMMQELLTGRIRLI